ncbi:UdgX family uracil-DNA binding protein [Gluconobacter kanchanaburiensis]|uniref:Type-4 uracil-DNA glycosylase n=1 Tax=Gluconobacter kanchanaburiensis NBRC 103587 TaxID=1307948 RepID=A0A511BFM8_9PROT|nr:UdgX family uracil-DNA binding protein [Gluconobacter kanchanaburiensis]MBF0862136.1 UdgX family uracil-DNA binding protein [Gluconobacter kanchanaburiensis]GBR71258.1 uracil-DNA glycosylase [Gluconobacter kanchanaburiensis NBRC 103587]GEK96597.1 uracil-DNA glycosylase [Gluconobacter kanchanaburiensis NBRC 103587]
MRQYVLTLEDSAAFEPWRERARAALQRAVPPEALDWRIRGGETDLFGQITDDRDGLEALTALPVVKTVTLRASCIALLRDVLCHSDPGRFALAYRIAWRVQGNPHLLEVLTDADIARSRVMVRQNREDCHKMAAFLRFREEPLQQGEGQDRKRRRFLAWFEPQHHILERIAPFFSKRFTDMDWMILTPRGSIRWDGKDLVCSPEPCEQPELDDGFGDLWDTYYASTFNPARVRTKAMRREMPGRYWKNLPETRLIPQLVAGAETRVRTMAEQELRPAPAFHERLRAREQLPAEPIPDVAENLEGLAMQVRTCTGCPLHCPATQAVVGEGPANARVMVVGEQPGDQEDLAGRPFVGPAGQLLHEALGEAGVDRSALYLTNAVKHFRFRLQGRRRIHQTPDAGHVAACRPWLEQEIALIRPKLIVSLGATALRALDGPGMAMSDVRGTSWTVGTGENAVRRLALAHPSWLLRLGDGAQGEGERQRFLEGLARLRNFPDQSGL